jgi:hypothetical protein
MASRSARLNPWPLGGDVITFEALTAQIHAEALVRISGDEEAWDTALGARDSDRLFEEAWSEAHDFLRAAASEEDWLKARDLSREAFLPVSKRTGQHEIASYVADDVELLSLAALTRVSNTFADQLYSAYVTSGFAVPPIA